MIGSEAYTAGWEANLEIDGETVAAGGISYIRRVRRLKHHVTSGSQPHKKPTTMSLDCECAHHRAALRAAIRVVPSQLPTTPLDALPDSVASAGSGSGSSLACAGLMDIRSDLAERLALTLARSSIQCRHLVSSRRLQDGPVRGPLAVPHHTRQGRAHGPG